MLVPDSFEPWLSGSGPLPTREVGAIRSVMSPRHKTLSCNICFCNHGILCAICKNERRLPKGGAFCVYRQSLRPSIAGIEAPLFHFLIELRRFLTQARDCVCSRFAPYRLDGSISTIAVHMLGRRHRISPHGEKLFKISTCLPPAAIGN
jgi:hypothetical protein